MMLDRDSFYAWQEYSDHYFRKLSTYSLKRKLFENEHFLSAKHSCVIGEKGVGKTVLSCQKALHMHSQDKILYCSLDAILFANFSMVELAKSAEVHGKKLVIFDEIHRHPNWKNELKEVIDTTEVMTIATGSSILSFTDLGGLSRRTIKYTLTGLSFSEFLKFKFALSIGTCSLSEICNSHRKLSQHIKKLIEAGQDMPVLAIFELYLRTGYYIYSLNHEVEADFLRLLLQSTEDTIAYEIVVAQKHSRPDMARRLQAIFKAISQNVPYTVNYEDLKNYSGVSDTRTLKHYLSCLMDAGLLRTLYKPALKGLRKPDKLYLGNSCLYYAYASLKPNMGSIRETFFLTALALANMDVQAAGNQADFVTQDKTFEVGGPKKSKAQIKDSHNGFVVKDGIEISADPKVIPLWLMGFLGPDDG